MAKFKQGDTVVFDDQEYKITSFDDINEEWVINNGEEELTVDESLLFTPKEYAELIENIDLDVDDDSEDEDEDLDEETSDEDEDDSEDDDEAVEEEAEAEEVVTAKSKDRKFEDDETFEEETAAAKTIRAHPSAAMDSAKTAMISNTISAMSAMGKSDMVDFFNKMMAQIGHEADSIPSNAADNNEATIRAKKVAKEDFDEILDGVEGLSEEVKEKISTLFESAVHLRVTDVEKDLVEAYEEKIDEKATEIKEELSEQIDEYLSHVANEWVEKNEVAVENNLKTEMVESFLVGLHGLFEQHYVEIPEDKVDAVEALAEKVEELENALNEQVEANIALTEAVSAYAAEEIFNEIAEGLAMTQVEKLRTLVETVDFEGDEDAYREKIKSLKEAHFKVKSPENKLNEEVDIDEDEPSKKSESELLNPQMSRYAQAISRTVKK